MLKSVKNEDMVIKLAKDVIGMCEKRGFKLTKFISNSRKVQATIPDERQHQKQSFPYGNHCKCYQKLGSRLWPVLFTLTVAPCCSDHWKVGEILFDITMIHSIWNFQNELETEEKLVFNSFIYLKRYSQAYNGVKNVSVCCFSLILKFYHKVH